MENPKKRILYIYPGGRSTFIAKDIRLLSEKFIVEEYFFNSSNKKSLPWELLKQIAFLKFHLFRYDLYLIKFSGYWSLFPVLLARLFGRKSMIITGGTDCVGFPSIGYGNFQNKLLSWFTVKSYRKVSKIIALHESMLFNKYSYSRCVNKSQGIKTFIPNLATPSIEIANGYDADFWKPIGTKNPKTFVTVATGLGENRRRLLKGIDLILAVAPYFPEAKFYIVGTNDSEIANYPENVILIPKKTPEELVSIYSQSQFYLQLSMSEGFPNSLCEAMLCECVPIVSNVASMPYIIGDSGFVLEKKDVAMLKELISNALVSDTETLGKKARRRIAENFTEEKRKDELIAAVESLFSAS